MSVKLIAVDMDGTFLSDAKTYNRPRFLNQYQRMREQNIRFVVASGNQYFQLISFFPDIAHEIAFVAENGGWVVSAGDDVFNCQLPKDHFHTVIDYLQTLTNIEIIACGKRSAYTYVSAQMLCHAVGHVLAKPRPCFFRIFCGKPPIKGKEIGGGVEFHAMGEVRLAVNQCHQGLEIHVVAPSVSS